MKNKKQVIKVKHSSNVGLSSHCGRDYAYVYLGQVTLPAVFAGKRVKITVCVEEEEFCTEPEMQKKMTLF